MSTFVASEYNIIDKSLDPVGKDFSTPSHHVPVFCSLNTLSPLCFNDNISILVNIQYIRFNLYDN